MATKAALNAAARDLVAAWLVKRRAEIQAEIDAYRDQRVQQLRDELAALRTSYGELIAVAEGERTVEDVVNPPVVVP